MIVNLSASTVRARARRAGLETAITIRTGRAAERAEGQYVDMEHCSVRVAVASAGVEEWLESLPCGDGDPR